METSDISVVFSAQKDNIAPRKNAATLLLVVFFIQLFCISIHFFHCFGSKISSGVFEMERKKNKHIRNQHDSNDREMAPGKVK